MGRAIGIILGGLWGVAATLGAYAVADQAYPLDLSRLNDVSRVIEDREGRPLHVAATATGRYRLPTSPEKVDRRYVDMLIAYEDRRFLLHPGIDPFALARAVGQWAANGHAVSGGSTLTMQTARLLEPRPRTVGAKLIEMFRAIQLEMRYSKNEILGMYMTLAPFGGQVDGVRAASLAYFGAEPAHLTAAQAALLVVLPQAPSRLRPDRHPARAGAARAKVLARAGLDPATEAPGPVPDRQRPFPHLARHLADRFADGSGAVRTTIDLIAQEGIAKLAARAVGAHPTPVNAAIVVLDNRSRKVIAHIGNAAPLDRARFGYLDLTTARRSPGSTLKPLIYAKAFEANLLHPKTMISDRRTRFGDYMPRNFDRTEHGLVTVADALRLSLNTPAVKVLDRLGPVRFVAALKSSGLEMDLPDGDVRPSLAVGLGGVGVSLEALTAAYAALASDGRYCAPIIRLGAAEVSPCPVMPSRLVDDRARAWVRTILADAPRPVGWTESRTRGPVAFKTGTSYGYRDTWAVGFDDRYTVGVWVGCPDGASMPNTTGLSTAAPLLFAALGHLPRPPVDTTTGETFLQPLGDAPPALERFEAATASASGTEDGDGPELTFPPDGVQMLWADIKETGVKLEVRGGQRPLHWMVNGRPNAANSWQRSLTWKPEGPGTYRLAVIDRDGKTANATLTVRHDRP